MKHQFFFHGYSDDVVGTATCNHDKDEYCPAHYLLSNGMTVKANYDYDGWEFDCSDESAVLVPMADPEDEGIDHTDARIPEWLGAAGYSPVLIVESDEPLTIISWSEDPFPPITPEIVFAAKLRAALANEDSDMDDVTVETVLAALQAAGWKGGAN